MIGIARIMAAALLLTGAAAMAAPTAADLRAGMAGAWTGALGYRDYQTNRLFELPVETRISLEGDGVTQVRVSKFDEGPGAKPVWITTVSLDDPVAGTVASAAVRAGRAIEVTVETVQVVRHAGPADWQIVYLRRGQDGDGDAEIRVTETRKGDEVLAVKEVRPVGAAETAWAFRNRMRLVVKR